MPSTSSPQIQSTVLTHLHYYDETDFNEGNGLKDLQTEMAALKLNCEHSPNAESSGDGWEIINLLLGQIHHLKMESGKK